MKFTFALLATVAISAAVMTGNLFVHLFVVVLLLAALVAFLRAGPVALEKEAPPPEATAVYPPGEFEPAPLTALDLGALPPPRAPLGARLAAETGEWTALDETRPTIPSGRRPLRRLPHMASGRFQLPDAWQGPAALARSLARRGPA